jgi:hypothetical protein
MAKINFVLFWVMKPCTLVGEYQRFEEIYCLHLQGRRISVRSLGSYSLKRLGKCICLYIRYLPHITVIRLLGQVCVRVRVCSEARHPRPYAPT